MENGEIFRFPKNGKRIFLILEVVPKNGKRRNSPFSKINGNRDFLRFPKKTENGEFPDFRKTRKTGLLKGVFSTPFQRRHGFSGPKG